MWGSHEQSSGATFRTLRTRLRNKHFLEGKKLLVLQLPSSFKLESDSLIEVSSRQYLYFLQIEQSDFAK